MRGALAGAVLIGVVAWVGAVHAGDGLDPCVQEDSAGPCYWDAVVMGNGEGQSFTRWADGTVTYCVEAGRWAEAGCSR